MWRRLRRRVRELIAHRLVVLASATLPRLYVAYMWLVWKTSRVEDIGFSRIPDVNREHNGFVGMLWHEEVFSVAWAYRPMKPHTLASVGDSGEVVTRMLELCGFVVFRGGSSLRRSRRRAEVLVEMIKHMKSTDNVAYGITVDGSKGPRYEIKKGALVIARECRKPMILVRTWARRNIQLPTWDRMCIPLPFNHIRQYMRGPFHLPPNAKSPEVLETFRLRMQDELNDMAEISRRF